MTEQVSHAIDWAGANWVPLTACAVMLLQVINKLTKRWDEKNQSVITMLPLVITEFVSLFTSQGWKTSWGHLKWPFTLRSGVKKRGGASPVSLLLIIGGAAIASTQIGCNAGGWRADANKALKAAHETTKAAWDSARSILHARCVEAGKACVESGHAGKMEDCEQIANCRARRSNVITAYVGAQQMIANASRALREYDTYKAAMSNMVASDIDGSDEKELARTKAEAQELINRAQRSAINLVRWLASEGLGDAGG